MTPCSTDLPHVIEAQQFNCDSLENIFSATRQMRERLERDDLQLEELLLRKKLAVIFYEPSLRTRFSFEIALSNLGGKKITSEDAEKFSSTMKGETLEDTIRVIGGYLSLPFGSGAILLRHTDVGAARRAAAVSAVPIINAGDGKGQHPTQALLDMYTVQDELGSIDGLTIALVGDLKHGRTVHSLAYLLAKYKIKKLYLVAPEEIKMDSGVCAYLKKHHIDFEETTDLYGVAAETDVLYQTRIQKERFENPSVYEKVRGQYVIDQAIVDCMRPKARILHPLPRVGEIDLAIDSDPRAAYFRQAHNGLFVRMALLEMIFNQPETIPRYIPE